MLQQNIFQFVLGQEAAIKLSGPHTKPTSRKAFVEKKAFSGRWHIRQGMGSNFKKKLSSWAFASNQKGENSFGINTGHFTLKCSLRRGQASLGFTTFLPVQDCSFRSIKRKGSDAADLLRVVVVSCDNSAFALTAAVNLTSL